MASEPTSNGRGNGAVESALAPAPSANGPAATPPGRGLSAKLLILTIVFVMISEVLVFVPSVSNFRQNWLMERLAAAQIAALDGWTEQRGPGDVRTKRLNGSVGELHAEDVTGQSIGYKTRPELFIQGDAVRTRKNRFTANAQ